MKGESDDEIDERRNPQKRVDREKEFKAAGNQTAVYKDPKEMLSAVTKYSNSFRSNRFPHPKEKDITILGFSLAARGPQEDEVYAEHIYFRNNIRRGNTLILTEKDVVWGRKGLMKFFDISTKSIEAIIESDLRRLDKRTLPTHYAIFSEIENTLSFNEDVEEKASVHVYRLNKANGENAQISYFKEKDEWIISSKNVSILVRDRADIKHYNDQRYCFSNLIAETWFNILDLLPKEDVLSLKIDLFNKTIIGEYCGNPEYQHLVKYEFTTIYFYALVENNSEYTCVPPPEAFAFLEKHHLPIVMNYEKSHYGTFTNFVELAHSLQKLFKEVATASIFEEEEGSVVYFVMELPRSFCEYISDRMLQKTVPINENYKEKANWIHVASLGKLKTLEYRILRKLREKLKFFGRMKNKEDNEEKNKDDFKKLAEKYGSFEKETYDLMKDNHLAKPIEYYFSVALLAFEYVFLNRKSPRNLNTLNDHYLDFLSVVFWCVENKKEITPQIMGDDQLKKLLRLSTWENYSIEIAKHYEELLHRIVPKYAKIKKDIGIEKINYDQENEK